MNTALTPESPANPAFSSSFVSIDLSRAGHDLRPIVECLSTYPDVIEVQANAWIVSTLGNGEELFAALREPLPDGGRMWMSETTSAYGWVAGDYRTALQIRSRLRM